MRNMINRIKNKNELLQNSIAQKTVKYEVQHGDTLYKIAKRYGITVGQLQIVNFIKNGQQLEVGQELYIPKSIINLKG